MTTGLILETSCNFACLLLAKDKTPQACLSLSGGAELSKNLGAEAKRFLEGKKCDYVAVGVGPGSYTGIRVGVALGQSLAFGWGVPVINFCSLYAFSPWKDRPFAVLSDARIGGLYCFQQDKQIRMISLQEAKTELIELPLFSPHPEVIQQRWDVPIERVEVNPQLISSHCYEEFVLGRGQSSLDPVPFIYGVPPLNLS